MKAQILKIADKLRFNKIDDKEAQQLLLDLFLVSERGKVDTSFDALVVKRPTVNDEDKPKMMYCGTNDWGDDVWQPT